MTLPETLGEAAQFGRSQKYFSWIRNQNQNQNQRQKEQEDKESTYHETYRKTDGEELPLNSR